MKPFFLLLCMVGLVQGAPPPAAPILRHSVTTNSLTNGISGQVLTTTGNGLFWGTASGGAQTPWLSGINGAGFSLTNTGSVLVESGAANTEILPDSVVIQTASGGDKIDMAAFTGGQYIRLAGTNSVLVFMSPSEVSGPFFFSSSDTLVSPNLLFQVANNLTNVFTVSALGLVSNAVGYAFPDGSIQTTAATGGIVPPWTNIAGVLQPNGVGANTNHILIEPDGTVRFGVPEDLTGTPGFYYYRTNLDLALAFSFGLFNSDFAEWAVQMHTGTNDSALKMYFDGTEVFRFTGFSSSDLGGIPAHFLATKMIVTNGSLFAVRNQTVDKWLVDTVGNTVQSGTLTTADPGSGIAAWSLGKTITEVSVALVITNYVEVKIDGVVRKLALVQ